jgi:DNA-binding NtrC family response regulator
MDTDTRPIFVIDDEQLVADSIATILRSNGYQALAMYDPENAIAQLEITKPAVVISDVEMPGMNGVQLAVLIRERYPDCRVLLFSGHAETVDLLDDARRQGHVFEILQKPIPPTELLARIAA